VRVRACVRQGLCYIGLIEMCFVFVNSFLSSRRKGFMAKIGQYGCTVLCHDVHSSNTIALLETVYFNE